MTTRLYYVDVIPRHAACTDNGHTFDIWASNRAFAITHVRRLVRERRLYTCQDEPLVYTARRT